MISPEDTALNRAKVGLMQMPNNAFISTVLFSLKFQWDDSLPTASVDGVTLKINPEFFLEQNDKVRISVLAHECWHICLNHITRCGTRNHRKFNRAGDYAANIILSDAGFEIPHTWLLDSNFRNMLTEKIYDLIPDEPDDDKPSDGDIIYASGEPDENDTLDSKIQDIILKAVMQSKMQGDDSGSIPDSIARMVDERINPTLPWNVIYQNYMTEYAKEDYSFMKPNRRFMPDMYLPSLYSEGIADLAYAIDTSGSVLDHEFSLFLAEISSAREMLNPNMTTIIDFDTTIKNTYELSKDQSVGELEFNGYGGTNLTPIFEYFADKKPTILTVFSDLFCPVIKKDPGYPVIWICVNNPTAKVNFGTLIHITT